MLELGEVSRKLQSELAKTLHDTAKEAHDTKHLNEFWIILSHRFDRFLVNVIRQAIVVSTVKPRPMLMSMCFHVIWDKGLIEPEWILPRDIPMTDEVSADGYDSSIYKQAAALGSGAFA